jgi:hypothetical protein
LDRVFKGTDYPVNADAVFREGPRLDDPGLAVPAIWEFEMAGAVREFHKKRKFQVSGFKFQVNQLSIAN